jgi:methyl-accepting chemotaxis protein
MLKEEGKIEMRLTVRKKLTGGFLIILLLLGIVVGIGNYQINSLTKSYSNILDNRVQKVNLVKDLQENTQEQFNSIRAYLLTGQKGYLDSYDDSVKAYDKTDKKLTGLLSTDNEKQNLNKLRSTSMELEKLVQKFIMLKEENNEVEYVLLVKTSAAVVSHDFRQETNAFVNDQEKHLTAERATIADQVRSTNLIFLGLSIFALLLSLGIALIISRQISIPIIKASKVLERVADGDLTIKEMNVKSRDEVGTLIHSLNRMIRDLRGVVTHVYDSSIQVASSSEQLTASAEQSTSSAEHIVRIVQDSVEGTSKQLDQFSDVTFSIKEMAHGIEQIAGHSEDMLRSAEEAAQLTKDGSSSVTNVVNQMNEINDSVIKTTSIIQNLGNRSHEIRTITELITTIADQTNLLALNAAIEAARAGEHGKGFAVVADEVRKLAEQSKLSADKITGMIGLIQTETTEAVISMEAGNKKVSKGLSYTEETNKAFRQIEHSIQKVSEKVGNVSSSVEELQALSDQIILSINHVKQIAEQIVVASKESSSASEEQLATIEEVSSSAQSLSNLAEELQSVVRHFKINE